jgi:transposase
LRARTEHVTVLEINGDAGDRGVPGAEGERDSAVAARASLAGAPDRELVERAKRRRFTAEYKLKIVREAEACTRPGEIGALLRREGLYSSLLTEWRRARDSGALEALERPRGRPKADPRDVENAELRALAQGTGEHLPYELRLRVLELHARRRRRGRRRSDGLPVAGAAGAGRATGRALRARSAPGRRPQ